MSHFRGNIIKNILVLLIAILSYSKITQSLAEINIAQTNDFLLIISMLLVTVCFANFAFTYEKSKLQTKAGILLGHFATGIFMLVAALLFESLTVAVQVVYPSFYGIILGISILLYLGIVLYDFWDLARAEK